MKVQPYAAPPAQADASVKQLEQETLADRANEIWGAIARRAYEMFEGSGCECGHEVEHWLKAEAEFLRPVPIEVQESGSAFTMRAEIPGFTPKELSVSVEPRRVLIYGKKETQRDDKMATNIISERSSSEILRAIDLPSEVTPGKVSAMLRDGVLELTLPKQETMQKEVAKGQAA